MLQYAYGAAKSFYYYYYFALVHAVTVLQMDRHGWDQLERETGTAAFVSNLTNTVPKYD